MRKITTTLKSFDEVLKNSETKNVELLKAKKEAELQQGLQTAKINALNAQGEYEKALVSEGTDVAVAVLNLEKATKTYEFYQELYTKVFPNA